MPFLKRGAPVKMPNLETKMALELPKNRPRGAYRSPKSPVGAKNRPNAAQNPSKPPQGGAHTPFQASILDHFGMDLIIIFNHFQSMLRLDFESN